MTGTGIRVAVRHDVEMLGIVAPAACAEAYGGFWDRPDAYARQLATFGPASFTELLARSDAHLWVAETDGTVVGFTSLILDVPDPIEGRAGGAELSRLYLLAPARSSGLGGQLLAAATGQASRHGASYLWLEAMDTAQWALRAYDGWGFREIGRKRFEGPVRPEVAGMVVMAKEL